MDTSIELGHVYRARIIDNALKDALESAGAVLIEGARASGKTMTAMHAASSYAFIDDPANRLVMEVAPRTLLEGEAPRLLDEWQVAARLVESCPPCCGLSTRTRKVHPHRFGSTFR
ncbi:MAG: hypothetical protein V9F03_01520 [Microthrixaceae bacterium]